MVSSLRDIVDILNIMKANAKDVHDNAKPCNIVYGTVTAINPLLVKVHEKLTLSDKQLKLTRSVMDYEVEMTLNGAKQTYKVHNALSNGDKVTMIRALGGQQYLVIDKEVV